MIRLLEDFDGSGLRDSHYSRVIKSHLESYGTGYDFCRFYEIFHRKRVGIISIFNGSAAAELLETARPTGMLKRELWEFSDFVRPAFFELPAELVPKGGIPGCKGFERTFFEINPAENPADLTAPDPEQAFKTIGLPESSYPVWLTDTLRRVNQGKEELFGYKSSVLTVRFKTSRLAFITDLATPNDDREKGQAGTLLRSAAAILKDRGYTCYTASKPALIGFYGKLGCKLVGKDEAFEIIE